MEDEIKFLLELKENLSKIEDNSMLSYLLLARY